MAFLDGAERESEKGSGAFHHSLEFSLLGVGPVLRTKRGSADTGYVGGEGRAK